MRNLTFHQSAVAVPRRRFLLGSMTVAGAVAGMTGFGRRPAVARSTPDPRPRPIPGGLANGTFHVNLNSHTVPVDPTSPIYEQSSITDFDGVIASHHIQGTGTGTDLVTGTSVPLAFDTDMRFMQGHYVGMDGKVRYGTFGFI